MATMVTVVFDDDDQAELFLTCVDSQIRGLFKNGWKDIPVPTRVMASERVEEE